MTLQDNTCRCLKYFEDKNAHKRTIKAWIDKLTLEENSPFDLSERLHEALENHTQKTTSSIQMLARRRC